MNGFPPIGTLLPHTGRMVLLDDVTHFDRERVICTTSQHRSADNPMRVAGRMPAMSGIEFAAQAMAVHGALRRTPPAALRAGRLLSVRDVAVGRRFLDDVEGTLIVECTLEGASADVFAYRFTVAVGGTTVLSGRAAVLMSERELA